MALDRNTCLLYRLGLVIHLGLIRQVWLGLYVLIQFPSSFCLGPGILCCMCYVVFATLISIFIGDLVVLMGQCRCQVVTVVLIIFICLFASLKIMRVIRLPLCILGSYTMSRLHIYLIVLDDSCDFCNSQLIACRKKFIYRRNYMFVFSQY